MAVKKSNSTNSSSDPKLKVNKHEYPNGDI